MTTLVLPRNPGRSNKVPEVTLTFWLIKLLAVTVGETAADYMNLDLGLGLATTSWMLAGVLVLAMTLQFGQRTYVPWVYWLTVVLISVVGTLVTDNLVDVYGVSLEACTVAFSLALAVTFAVWFAFEKTLSIHAIDTPRREGFYWLAILFTFALGTAVGDWCAEALGLGYLSTGALFAAIIAVIAFAYGAGANAILTFWATYILTRPLGASLGDLLSQPFENGGLGFGTVATSYIFLACIAALIVVMTFRQRDDVVDLGTGGDRKRVRTRLDTVHDDTV